MATDEEDRQLRAVALQSVQSILRARQRAEEQLLHTKDLLEEKTRTLELLNRTAVALISNLDLQAIVQTVTDAATDLSGAEFGAFFYTQRDDRGELLTLFTLSGAPREAFEKLGHPRATSIFGPTLRGEAVIRIDDVLADPRYGSMSPHHGMPPGHLPVRSYLAVPVVSRSGEVIGGLFFGHPQAGVFTERVEQVIVGIAAQAAIAIDNARLYESTRRQAEERARLLAESQTRARHLALAAQVGNAMNSTNPTDHKLGVTASAIVEHLGATAAQIWLYEPHDAVLVRRSCAGLAVHAEAPAFVRVGQFAVGKVAETRRRHVSDQADPQQRDPGWNGDDVRAVAGFPMLVGDRLIGVIMTYGREPFDDAALVALAGAADHVALGIDRDRGDLERAERERFRELFIAVLGHDLRNPLGAITTGIETLRITSQQLVENAPLAVTLSRMQQVLGRMKGSAGRMARMIDQILDFARLRVGGGIPVHPVDADLRIICDTTVEELRAAYPSREIHCQMTGDTRGQWDLDRLAQVVSNLLSNALDHGDPHGPVSVCATSDDERTVIEVHNQGPPIPAEALPHLFDPFRRAQSGKTATTKGLGLGLYITQEIANAHGGTLRVTSTSSGTMFTVEVPRAHTFARKARP